MTTDRSYRKARSPREAIAELHACAGSQFDPEVVAALIAVADTAPRIR
jgi:HD-GYP domain-containing protein (c-di-GMP phosphodiesterase class II)